MDYLVIVVNTGLEHILAYAAQRAAPVVRQVLKCCAGSNAMLRVALFRVISITAGIAKIFFHIVHLLYFVLFGKVKSCLN